MLIFVNDKERLRMKFINATQLRKKIAKLPSEKGFVKKSTVMKIIATQECVNTDEFIKLLKKFLEADENT